MNLICFILGHDEDVHHQMLYCTRCKVWIADGYAPNPELQPSLELAGHWRAFVWAMPYHGRFIQRCEEGHIKRVFGRDIGNHTQCDVPF